MCDFSLLPWCKCDLLSFGILRSAEWWFIIDVAGPHIGPTFQVQGVQNVL